MQHTVDLDFWFTLSCLAHGAYCLLVPKPYYFLRTRGNSTMMTTNSVRLKKSIEVAQVYLKQDIFRQNSPSMQALSVNLSTFKRYRDYFRIVETLKAKKYTLALLNLWQNPKFFIILIARLPGIFSRWFQCFILGARSTYKTAHLRN